MEDLRARGVASRCGDDEGHARGGGHGGGSAVGRGGTAEELDAGRVARRDGHLVDHHGDRPAAAQHGPRARDGAQRVRELHAEPRPRRLPEAVHPAHAEVLGDHEQLHVLRHGARRQVPVARVRRGDDDAPTLARAPRPTAPASPRRSEPARAPAGPAASCRRTPRADTPSAAYIAAACSAGRSTPASRIDSSTCARRMRRTRARDPPQQRAEGPHQRRINRSLLDGPPCPPGGSPSKATA